LYILCIYFYIFHTGYFVVLFLSLTFADDCFYFIFVCIIIVAVISHQIVVMLSLLLFLLETVSDIMPQKAVVTQDSSTPDVQSTGKHVIPRIPDVNLPVQL